MMSFSSSRRHNNFRMSEETPPNRDGSRSKSNSLHLSAQELKCKNGCGFYGNPEWQGYCSKCHREIHQKVKVETTKHTSKKLARSHSDAHEISLSSAFSKFEEKKKQQSEKKTKTLKSLFNRGNTLKESSHSPRREFRHHSEADPLGREFADFLRTFSDDAAADVRKQLKMQLNQMHKSIELSIDDRSEFVQDFYQHMYKRCETSALYQDVSSDSIEKLMDFMEKTMLTYLYRSVFQQISSEYEEKDLALQKRIRSLNWITAQHLDTEINENHPEVRDLIDKAITDIIEMDSRKAPQEKLSSIVSCCKSIFDILLACRGQPASADEFLPAMVYIVLKANPPLLQSNIKFITSYSIPTRLMSGEGGYYFTNLCCAVAFIEGLTAESLNLSKEDYDRYISGEAVPPGVNDHSPPVCEGLRLFYQNLSTLNELAERQEKLITEASSLHEDMNKFQESISANGEVEDDAYYDERPYTIPADVDIKCVPSFLRSRVVKESPKDGILVDIDSDAATCSQDNPGISNTQHTIDAENPIGEFTDIALTDAQVDIASHYSEEIISTTPLLPVKASDSLVESLDPCAASISTHTEPLTNDKIVMKLNLERTIPDIKNIEYPTELLDRPSSDLLSSNFMQSVSPSSKPYHLPDPLSPEPGACDESLSLPPPLQPVVLQPCPLPKENSNHFA